MEFIDDSISISLIGVKLTPKENLLINMKIQSLSNLSPANSSLNFTLVKKGLKKHGILQVTANGKVFKANSYGKKPIEILDTIIQRIEDQLIIWKKNRFNESLNLKTLRSVGQQ